MLTMSIKGVDLRLHTNPSLFSPNAPDAGTLAMLSLVQFDPNDKVLDLGCGYGVVGICAARLLSPRQVFMTDRDPLAIATARKNCVENGLEGITVILSDGFRELPETNFTKILSNPPYHVDFSVPKHFIEKGFNRLAIGGALWMVTKRRPWYENKLKAIFGGCRVHVVGDYFVFESIKKSARYANAAR